MTSIEQFADGDPIPLEIEDTIDLHGFRPQDIEAVLYEYLNQARIKRFSVVRIVHGKGIGVQREKTREVLRKTDFVVGFKTGDELSGGWGATIAKLKFD